MIEDRSATAVLVFLLGVVAARLTLGDFAPRQQGPHFSELWKCIPIAGAITVASAVARHWVFQPLVDTLVQHTAGSQSSKRVEQIKRKMCDALFNAIYFALVSLFAFTSLRKMPWFPRELGGSQTEDYWSGYPATQEPSAAERWYYFLNGGYRLHLGLTLCFLPRVPEFKDNLVQVVMSVPLIFFSFGSNYLRAGAVIMLLHDICDIFIALVKFTAEARWEAISLASASGVVALWSYLRLYCFLKIVLGPVYHFARAANFEIAGWPWLAVSLLCLLFMNFYWFTLLLKSIVVYLRSGRITDFHSHIETDGKKVA